MQDLDRPFRGRRLTWEQFYELRPDLKPANDNRVPDNTSRGWTEGAAASRLTHHAVTAAIAQR